MHDKTSKYDDLLRSKGFMQTPDMRVDGVPQTSPPDNPMFVAIPTLNITYVVDEHGQKWMGSGVHDLSEHGLGNASDIGRKVGELLGLIAKTQS